MVKFVETISITGGILVTMEILLEEMVVVQHVKLNQDIDELEETMTKVMFALRNEEMGRMLAYCHVMTIICLTEMDETAIASLKQGILVLEELHQQEIIVLRHVEMDLTYSHMNEMMEIM